MKSKMDYIKEKFKVIIEFFQELLAGFGLSGLGAMLLPELIHLVFVIISGIIGTIVIHLTRRWVNKKFPS